MSHKPVKLLMALQASLVLPLLLSLSHKPVKFLMALQALLMLPTPCLPALWMLLALEMVKTLLWPVLATVVSVRFLGRQLKAEMLLGLLVGGMVAVLVEAAAGGLIGVLIGVPETGHLKAGVMTRVLLGLQRMNGAAVRVCLLLQQLPLRLIAEQDLRMTLMIYLVVSLLLQLLPELLPMKVHVRWLLL